MSSASPMIALPTLLLLPSPFPPTILMALLQPCLSLIPRALRRIPLARAPAGLGGARPKSVLSPSVTSTDEASTTKFLLALLRIYHVHFFPALHDPCFTFLRHHMKRCVRVALIHFLVEMPRY